MNEDASARSNQAAYIEEKVEALVDQVDVGYGMALIEQLIQRLEITTKEFLAEVGALMDRLKQNAAAQEELLGRIRKSDRSGAQVGPIAEEGPEEEITEWEKRLARLEEPDD